MSEDKLLEVDGHRDRSTVAATLRTLADQLEGDEGITLTADEETVTLAPPEQLAFELDVEREGDEVEVEIELGWTGGEETVETARVGETAAEGGTVEDAEAPAESGQEASQAEQGEAEASETDEDTAGTDAGESSATGTGEGGTAAGAAQSKGQFQVYRDRADEWRWRLVHHNGNVIADSGEGYTARRNAEKGLRSVMQNAPGAEVRQVE